MGCDYEAMTRLRRKKITAEELAQYPDCQENQVQSEIPVGGEFIPN